MARFVGFVGPAYTLRSVNVDCQRLVNLYPESNELGTGKNQEIAALVGTPGLVRLSTMGTGPVRGLYQSSKSRTFAVSGTGFYEVTTPTAPSLLGTLTTGAGRVSMTDNGVDLVLVDGAKGYRFTFSTNTFQEITDPDFPAGASISQFFDQYIIVNDPDSQKFWFSALSDASSWDALDFQQAEGSPDNVIALLVDHRELILAGEWSTEVFFNSGDPLTPFTRIQGAFVEEGLAARDTLCAMDNTIFGLSKNKNGQGFVRRTTGYQAQRISTHAIELALASYGDLSGATAYTYQEKGHSFYVLNVPGAKTTWVFDAATNLWHERQSVNSSGQLDRHRGEVHCFSGGLHLVGDYENGNLYKFDDNTYTDDGQPITALRRAPHISNNGKRVSHPIFQLDMETGVGLASGQGSDPKAMLRWSNDGAKTWSNEHWTGIGKQGEYKARAIWRRLGEARDRVYEVSITDPVKRIFISAFIEPESAAH